MTRVFVSDCEGPISKNDNAFELTESFVPNGNKLFSLISRYDDVLVDLVKKPGYTAGSTLRLILPFLKAYNVSDQDMRQFSSQNMLLISGSKATLDYIRNLTKAFIISTSYEHYIRAFCEIINFPFENVYCTRLSLDKYNIPNEEREKLRRLAQEILKMPMIKIPNTARNLRDLSETDQNTVKRLDEIFWKEIANIKSGVMIKEVNTIGGEQKAEAIRDIAKKLSVSLSDIIYVGDSITDVEALQLVKSKGGLAVSFNGNKYAVENAEIAVLSENSLVTAVLTDIFVKAGKESVLNLSIGWNENSLRKSVAEKSLTDQFLTIYPDGFPKVQLVTSDNKEELVKESSEFRKKVRGEAVGRLG